MNAESIYRKLIWSQQEVKRITREYSELEIEITDLKGKSKDVDEAISILTAVLSLTQEECINFIRGIVADSLKYVYGDEYSFKIEFELKRNQPELILMPIKNGKELDPRNSCGVGVVDVCAFALRLSLWALRSDQTAPTLIFDEPFRHVHGKRENERLAEMVLKLSEKLNLQIICVSGESALKGSADRVMVVEMVDGESRVIIEEN